MTIHELLARFPADRLVFQRVDQSLAGAERRKGGVTEVAIYTKETTPEHLVTGAGPVGLLIWVPKDLWDEAVRAKEAGRHT